MEPENTGVVTPVGDGAELTSFVSEGTSIEEKVQEDVQQGGGMSKYAATSMFILTMVGAGLLAFPYKMMQVGLISGVALNVLAATYSLVTCLMMSRSIDDCMNKGVPVTTVGDVGTYFMGKLGDRLMFYSALIFMASKPAVYGILVGQMAVFLSPFIKYKAWVLITGALCLPIAFLRNMDFIAKTGFVGVIAAFTYVVTISGGGILAMMEHGEVAHFEAGKTAVFTSSISWLPTATPLAFASCFAIYLFGYGPHDMLPTVKKQMKDPKDCAWALIVSHMVVSMIYVIPPLLAYVGWGSSTSSNILNSMCYFPGCVGEPSPLDSKTMLDANFAGKKMIFGMILAGAVIISLLLKLPLTYFAIIDNMEQRFPGLQAKVPNTVFRVCLVLFLTFIALVIPFFSQFVGLVSSAVGGLLFGANPALITIYAARMYGLPRPYMAYFIVLVGLLVAVLGFTDSLMELIHEIKLNPESINPLIGLW